MTQDSYIHTLTTINIFKSKGKVKKTNKDDFKTEEIAFHNFQINFMPPPPQQQSEYPPSFLPSSTAYS